MASVAVAAPSARWAAFQLRQGQTVGAGHPLLPQPFPLPSGLLGMSRVYLHSRSCVNTLAAPCRSRPCKRPRTPTQLRWLAALDDFRNYLIRAA